MADVILKVEHLSKSFGPNAVLKDIDLSLIHISEPTRH